MLRFFRKNFALFAFGTAFLLSAGGRLDAADGTLYVVNYEDAATSPRARLVNLTERLKRLSRQVMSGRRTRQRREIFAVLSDGKKQKVFTYRMDKRGNMRIVLPDQYGKLFSEPGALPLLTAWYIFGHAGLDPELGKNYRNSWFAVGLARKAMEDMNPVRIPFSGYFPAAYTLTSVSRYPTLQSLLETPLLPEDTALRLVYEEYCELLVMICARNGLFKAGLLSKILDELEKDPQRKDMPELFRLHGLPHLKRRVPKLFKTVVGKAEIRNAYEIWFRKELDELLNNNFLPASSGKIERMYLKAVHFEGPLKKKDGEEPEVIRGRLAELVARYGDLAAPEKIAAGLSGELLRLIRIQPPDLKIPLTDVRDALQHFMAQPSGSGGTALLNAETAFFRALEKHLVLEKFLSDSETERVSPSVRYYLTFSLIGYEKQPGRQPPRHLAALLEQSQKEFEK